MMHPCIISENSHVVSVELLQASPLHFRLIVGGDAVVCQFLAH